MKRSEINQTIHDAIEFFAKIHFDLPPFAFFTPALWREKAEAYREVIDCRLGWDVTDVGLGDFTKTGRTIFTLRNGNLAKSSLYPKSYAQKAMYLLDDQRMPVHFHRMKMEDIINAGSGLLMVKVWPKNDVQKLTEEKFALSVSGQRVTVAGGTTFTLKPGESINMLPGIYHQFWIKAGTGPSLSMEISSTNDDLTDNIWLAEATRFPAIIEDEEKKYILCSEYEK